MGVNGEEILTGLQSGNEKCYRELFAEYYPQLTVFAKKYVEDLDIARDIVQDMFVWLYESRDSIKSIRSLKPYLFKSVKNRCLNYLNTKKIHQVHEAMILTSQSNVEYDVESKMAEVELEEKIFQVVSGLPEKCQIIFRMSRVEGKRNSEIANDLDISIRTVETQISKALKVLRSVLIHYLKLLLLVLMNMIN